MNFNDSEQKFYSHFYFFQHEIIFSFKLFPRLGASFVVAHFFCVNPNGIVVKARQSEQVSALQFSGLNYTFFHLLHAVSSIYIFSCNDNKQMQFGVKEICMRRRMMYLEVDLFMRNSCDRRNRR